MNVVILLSRTVNPDIKLNVQNGKVVMEPDCYQINPPDEIALELALRLKEKHHKIYLTVITVDTRSAEKQLRLALAMGADKAVLIETEAMGENAAYVSMQLSEYLQVLHPEIILAGDFSTDGASSQVSSRVATKLNIPFLSKVQSIKLSDNQMVEIIRSGDDTLEAYAGKLPVLLTVPQGLMVPRLPTLVGIMKAKKKPLEVRHSSSLLQTSVVESSFYHFPENTRKKIQLEGTDTEKVAAMLQIINKST